MAKAYYPSGGSFKEWTPDMVGAFPSQTIGMPSTAEARYYLLATVTAQQWGNYRCSFSINSRHSGCGMVTVAFGNNTDSLIHNNMYAQIYYYGTTNQVTDSQMFQVYGSADGKHYYLFAKSWDYNEYAIRVFASDFVLSRGDALTSIPIDTYGTILCNTTINPSNSVSWNNVSGKPSTYTPSSHTHSKSEVGLGNVDNTADSSKSVKYAASAGSANAVAWGNISGKPSTYAPSSHTHDDRYYTESEVNTKLNGKANSSHTHDDRYYTESEMNTKLNAKAASDIVTISSTKPTSNTCKIWIKI